MKLNARMGYFAVAGLCLLLGSAATAAPTGKIKICHKAGERNQRILSINEEKDGEKHFGHGDYFVTDAICEDLIADNNCDGVTDTQAENNYNCVIQEDNSLATCDDGLCVVPAVGNVFVTSGVYTADLIKEATDIGAFADNNRGVEAGDAICNHLAQLGTAVDQDITYAAWLSDSTHNAIDRIGEGPYILSNGAVVAVDKADLTDESIQNAINLDEFGALATGTDWVWTNTYENGLKVSTDPAQVCGDWSNSSLSLLNIPFSGFRSLTSASWTICCAAENCGSKLHLYCFPAAETEVSACVAGGGSCNINVCEGGDQDGSACVP